jgi:hypothetical protein
MTQTNEKSLIVSNIKQFDLDKPNYRNIFY